jgi:hypothetical protein
MRKLASFFLGLFLLSGLSAYSQLELAKLMNKRYHDMLPGIGASLKFGYPVSEAADVTLEAGVILFFDKDYPETYGVAIVPVKLGYRHTLNGSGTGFYVEPQVGYNVYGAETLEDYETGEYIDRKSSGFIWAAGIGYLFQPSRRMQFNLGLRYESILDKDHPKNFIGLRLSHNFTFGRRE